MWHSWEFSWPDRWHPYAAFCSSRWRGLSSSITSQIFRLGWISFNFFIGLSFGWVYTWWSGFRLILLPAHEWGGSVDWVTSYRGTWLRRLKSFGESVTLSMSSFKLLPFICLEEVGPFQYHGFSLTHIMSLFNRLHLPFVELPGREFRSHSRSHSDLWSSASPGTGVRAVSVSSARFHVRRSRMFFFFYLWPLFALVHLSIKIAHGFHSAALDVYAWTSYFSILIKANPRLPWFGRWNWKSFLTEIVWALKGYPEFADPRTGRLSSCSGPFTPGDHTPIHSN